MNPELASASTNAIVRTCHPRNDFRTEEARKYTSRLVPFLQKAIYKGQRVLDLGCGTGKFTFELETLGAEAFGVDCSKEAIGYARKIASDINSSAKFYLGEFENLPFSSESFDAVLFPQNIIECSYLEMDRIAFQLQSILCKNGRFYLEMQDGLDRANNESMLDVDKVTGLDKGKISIPGEGSFIYDTTFWTIAFARYIVSRHLSFIDMQVIDDKRYMLSFGKGN